MSTPPLLVFDLDGTLAETAGDLIETLNFILAREGSAAGQRWRRAAPWSARARGR
jgi:phosphoglycolate phosphatase-like HAD superfamily hydrolase